MKTLQKLSIAAAIAVCCGLGTVSEAQIIVKVRPPMPRAVVVRPPAPSPRHVWIEEDWRGRGGRDYEYRGGRWEAPPRPGWIWVGGRWDERRGRGWVWVPGRWRRP